MRGRPPLQGDLEGKPGRDLEVHHQGPDHALARAFPRAAAAAAALVLFLGPSCGSPGGEGTAPTRSPAPDTPGQGTIIYHEPLPSRGIEKKTAPPKTFIFTTAEEELAEDEPVRTFSGTVKPGEDASAVARRVLTGQKANTRILSPTRFSDLWSRLADTGILELPRHRGKNLPEREDYFLFQSGSGRVVITRPAIPSPPRPDDPAIARLDAWKKAKLELFQFLNER